MTASNKLAKMYQSRRLLQSELLISFAVFEHTETEQELALQELDLHLYSFQGPQKMPLPQIRGNYFKNMALKVPRCGLCGFWSFYDFGGHCLGGLDTVVVGHDQGGN